MAKIIDGKGFAKSAREDIAKGVEELKASGGPTPGLAVVLVGEDPASQVYVNSKKKACKAAGIESFEHKFSDEVIESELLALINTLNGDPLVHGILVQLPLPKHIDSQKILEAIEPKKDVDGFHPYNVGRLMTDNPLFEPCTPRGIMELLDSIGYDLTGKEAVIVGRSNIVGKPMAIMLLRRHATVTICHSRTKALADKTRAADIVVAATGIPEMIEGDWIKEGAVVIDVGINRTKEGKLVGDVNFDEASKHASFITPVPGGVGPMTIAMLLKNTLDSARRTYKEEKI